MKRDEERETEKRADKKGAEREDTKWLKKLREIERWIECILERDFLLRLRQQATTGGVPAPPPDDRFYRSNSFDSNASDAPTSSIRAPSPPVSPSHASRPPSTSTSSFPPIFPYNPYAQQQPQPLPQFQSVSSSGVVPSPSFPTPPPYDYISAGPGPSAILAQVRSFFLRLLR